PQSCAHGHRRVDAKFSDFVTRGGDDTAAVDAAHDNGFPRNLWVVALFDRCVERIHVNMQNCAHGLEARGSPEGATPAWIYGAGRQCYFVTITVTFLETTGGLWGT